VQGRRDFRRDIAVNERTGLGAFWVRFVRRRGLGAKYMKPRMNTNNEFAPQPDAGMSLLISISAHANRAAGWEMEEAVEGEGDIPRVMW
jgi:hypothetical protein